MTKIYEKLTADWKAGKLPLGYFYVKYKNREIGIQDNFIDNFLGQLINPIIQVIAPVPTYDEYKAMQAELAELKEKIKKREELIQCLGSNIDELDVKKSVLIIENNKLRGLLKECKNIVAHDCWQEAQFPDGQVVQKQDLLTSINAALGESEEK
nr:MAG TPA: hypothetical protein [Caudoviricetes sp.]